MFIFILLTLVLALGSHAFPHTAQAADVWQQNIVDISGMQSQKFEQPPQLIFDATNRPHVLYFDYDGALVFAHYIGNTWERLPSPGEGDGYRALSLVVAADDTIYAMYLERASTTEQLFSYHVRMYDGDTWSDVGDQNAFPDTSMPYGVLTLDNNDVPHLAYSDASAGDRLSVAQFTGTAWEHLGTRGFSDGSAEYPALVFDGTNRPYVSYHSPVEEDVIAFESFSSGTWFDWGNFGRANPLGTDPQSSMAIASDGSLYILITSIVYSPYRIENTHLSTITLYHLNGDTFDTVATYDYESPTPFSASIAMGSLLTLSDNDIPHVSFMTTGSSTPTTYSSVMKYTDTTWHFLGNEKSLAREWGSVAVVFDHDDKPYTFTRFKAESGYYGALQSLRTDILCRFYSEKFRGHFFTASTDECLQIQQNDDWHYEGTAYAVQDANDSGATPVYRFWSDTYKHHFYTVSQTERDMIIANDTNWAYEGISYYVYKSPASDTTSVYRFWSENYKAHFYTASDSEKDSTTNDPNWAYEGVAWHVLK